MWVSSIINDMHIISYKKYEFVKKLNYFIFKIHTHLTFIKKNTITDQYAQTPTHDQCILYHILHQYTTTIFTIFFSNIF